jgi:4-carboxymuconolactone decarboxylase
MPAGSLSPTSSPRPLRWSGFIASAPEVASAYEALRDACAASGPLDGRTIGLVKLAVSIGRGTSRSVHRHAKKALRAGASPDDLRHTALLALPTIGLPATLDALKWIEESTVEEEAGQEGVR